MEYIIVWIYIIAFIGGAFSIEIIISFMKKNYGLTTDRYMKRLPFISFLATICCILHLFGAAVPDGYTLTNLVKVQNTDSNNTYYWNLKINIDKHDSTYDILGYVDPKSGELKKVVSSDFKHFGDINEFYINDKEYAVTINKKDIDTTFIQAIQYVGLFNILTLTLLLISTIWASILVIKREIFIRN